MLPTSYRQAYHTLLNALLTLQQVLCQVEQDVTQVQQSFEQVQQIFSEKILPLTPEQISPELVSRWQSIQTEIHRSLRLLATDILFWRTSSVATTKSARLTVISDRICRLIDYCQFIEGMHK